MLDPPPRRSATARRRRACRESVKSSVDPDANLISVAATAPRTRGRRRSIANAVAETFVKEQADVQRSSTRPRARACCRQLDSLRTAIPAPPQEQAIRAAPVRHRRRPGGRRHRPSIAQRAGARRTARRRGRCATRCIALFLGLFIGVLVALAPRPARAPRQRRPRAGPAARPAGAGRDSRRRRRLGRGRAAHRDRVRELPDARRVDPLLARPPGAPARRAHHQRAARRGQEHGHRPARPRARPGGAPHAAGLRRPALADPPRDLGVDESSRACTELLLEAGSAGPAGTSRSSSRRASCRSGPAAVATSTSCPAAPRRTTRPSCSPARAWTRCRVVRGVGYGYILVDAPPLLGIADTQCAGALCTSLLFVARLDRITLDTVIDARDVLDRLDVQAIGRVPIGTRSEARPTTSGLRAPALEDT